MVVPPIAIFVNWFLKYGENYRMFDPLCLSHVDVEAVNLLYGILIVYNLGKHGGVYECKTISGFY